MIRKSQVPIRLTWGMLMISSSYPVTIVDSTTLYSFSTITESSVYTTTEIDVSTVVYEFTDYITTTEIDVSTSIESIPYTITLPASTITTSISGSLTTITLPASTDTYTSVSIIEVTDTIISVSTLDVIVPTTIISDIFITESKLDHCPLDSLMQRLISRSYN